MISVKPKIHIIKNRILLFLILISELISFSLLYYFRYKNQNLALTGFENKTGNIVSAVLYLLISLMVIVNIFSSRKISVSYLWFILFVSIAASFALTAAGFLIQKEIRIVLSSVFIITNFFKLRVPGIKIIDKIRFVRLINCFFEKEINFSVRIVVIPV